MNIPWIIFPLSNAPHNESGMFIIILFCCLFQYFSFTAFAIALNELKDFMLDTLPPTDSRLRPDVRILEEGNIGI
jgi:4-hydroxybenzoate polyprenyltransferase